MGEQSLQDRLRESWAQDAERLLEAKEKAAELMAGNPGEEKYVRAFDAARGALEKHLAKGGGGGPEGSVGGFTNLNQVLGHLQGEGYKISRGRLYGDKCKAKLAPGADGYISMDTVEAFVVWAGLEKEGAPEETGEDREYVALSRDRQEAELRRLNAQAEREEIKLAKERGELLPREDLEGELCARAVQHDALLRRMVREEAADWVHLVEGRPERVRELQDVLNERIDGIMREFSSLDIWQVIVLPEGSDD